MNKKILIEYYLLGVKNLCYIVGATVLLVMLFACGENPEQLFETAQFEEQQHNQAHAKELYERILRDHAKSPVARQAEARLKELGKGNP